MDAQVDALFFQARETGVAYAIVDERVEHPGFQSHFGVRGRLGTEGGCDCWKGWLQYLHYHARVRDEVKGVVTPIWGWNDQIVGTSVPFAQSMWRLHMGLADLNLGKVWRVSHCLDFLLYTGLRYSEIRHKLQVNYGDESTLSMKNKSFGWGPLFGCFASFYLWDCISLFSRLSADLLYTKIYLHQSQKGALGKINLLDEYWQVRPQFEAALGIGAQWHHFFGQIAGEIYFFPEQNRLDQKGDLSLHGLSFGIGLEF